MALPWVRVDTTFPQNPKVLDLVQDRDGHRAGFVFLCGLFHAGGFQTGGFVADGALRAVHGRAVDAKRLVNHGFWGEKDGGWLIHDFADYQLSTEEAEQRRQRAQQRARLANCKRWHNDPECTCWHR